MQISIVSGKTYKKYKELQNIYPSRRAALRAAKRFLGLLMSKHPDEVVVPFTDRGNEYDLDERNVRLYIFYIWIGALVVEYHIREDKAAKYGHEDGKGDQLPHFNSGEHPGKKKDHRYWEDD